jgi:hypothetical protein
MQKKYINEPYMKNEKELELDQLVKAFRVLSFLGVKQITVDNDGLRELQYFPWFYDGLFSKLNTFLGVEILHTDKDRENDL